MPSRHQDSTFSAKLWLTQKTTRCCCRISTQSTTEKPQLYQFSLIKKRCGKQRSNTGLYGENWNSIIHLTEQKHVYTALLCRQSPHHQRPSSSQYSRYLNVFRKICLKHTTVSDKQADIGKQLKSTLFTSRPFFSAL